MAVESSIAVAPPSSSMLAPTEASSPPSQQLRPPIDQIKSANWSGSIPVVISLAPTSISSPTTPSPVHVLISRHTFLHVGLRNAVLRLHKYAPPTISFPTKLHVVEEPEPGEGASAAEDNTNNDDEKDTEAGDSISAANADGTNDKGEGQDRPDTSTSTSRGSSDANEDEKYPICWFEDEATELPLRWQLFAGILFDLCQSATATSSSAETSSSDSTRNGNNGTSQSSFIPWKIRLHFTNYPSSQILELDNKNGSSGGGGGGGGSSVWTTVQKTFKNSLKQALFLQYGNSKVAMNMTKQSHQQLWDSIISSKYSLYKKVHIEQNLLISSSSNNGGNTDGTQLPQLLPIRVLVNSQPSIQKKCVAVSEGTGVVEEENAVDEKNGDTEEQQQQEVEAKGDKVEEGGGDEGEEADEEAKQEEKEARTSSTTAKTKAVPTSLTLGDLLHQWIPEYFEEVAATEDDSGKKRRADDNKDGDDDDEKNEEDNSKRRCVLIKPKDTHAISWYVAGIIPSLDTLIWDLWKTLSHPDHFLYIIVTATEESTNLDIAP